MAVGRRSRAATTATALLAVLAGVALVALVGRLAGQRGLATDLFPRWYGLRQLLLFRRDPYGADISRELALQTWFYGGDVTQIGPLTALETAFGFLYPLPGALLLAPLALLPYATALAAWLLLILLALPAAAWLVVASTTSTAGTARSGRTARAATAARLLAVPLALLFLPAWANLVLAQPAALVVFLLALAAWLAGRRPPGPALAGACLVAAGALKPHLLVLVAPGWLGARLWRWRHGDGRARAFVSGAAAGAALLASPAFLLLPSWPAEFLQAAAQYYPVAPHSPALAEIMLAVMPPPAAWAATATVAAALLWLAADGWRAAACEPEPGREVVALSRSVVATLLLVPPAWETNAVLLLIPLAAALGRASSVRAVVALTAASVALSSIDFPLYLTLGWRNGPLLLLAYTALLHSQELYAALMLTLRPRSAPAPAAAAPSAPD